VLVRRHAAFDQDSRGDRPAAPKARAAVDRDSRAAVGPRVKILRRN
jgi:hypothetical protein